MQFSLWNIKEWFQDHDIDLSYTISEGIAEISEFRIVNQIDPSADFAQLIDVKNLHNQTGYRTALYYHKDSIFFPVASIEEVSNQINYMIEHFLLFERDLLSGIVAYESIDELLLRVRNTFPYPISLIYHRSYLQYSTSDWRISLDPANIRPLFAHAERSREQVFFRCIHHAHEEHTLIVSGISLADDGVDALLIASEEHKKFRSSTPQFLKSIASLLAKAIHFYATNYTMHPMASWYKQQLDQTASPVQTMHFHSTWSSTDYYQIAAISPSGSETDHRRELTSLLQSISNPDYCCVQVGDLLSVLIHRGNEYPKNSDASEAYLKKYSNEKSYFIGLSLLFRGLHHIPNYYQQSLLAMENARQRGRYLANMMDDLGFYIRRLCKTQDALSHYVCPEIRKLRSMEDPSSNEDLEETLYAYLIAGHSSADTSDQMFIHRNTLRHRIDKLTHLLQSDLKDEEVTKKLLYSLLL